ncbi:Sigma-F factor [Thalassovita gelatinovora]|uniref:Sigma-F factor n=1 Tax=Thalassovita gelatinovora TaxID=53501 RepID=A0A0P1FZS8_THAGE|nr:FliA/WhiG family RNA polymerase sigma factor [Thalassovita gelatinovora]QIZ79614.1 FliA/WhiG family RNA polymerase sigma factor [Thalassovita gelatinovora]CUH66539.1 Sigma-F factor [Thalassovita gelatinovora]SEQ37573.1 RNA polymerase, sigma 28 subunit, SigD/FliA/WhiG [Thalassovita gelatinovora]
MIAQKGYTQQTTDPDTLVKEHMPLVRKLAWHFMGRVGQFAEIDDLLQAGYLGLIDASRRYTVQEGVSFSAYAAIRVRGAIVDLLRRNSNLCRSTISMQQKARIAERTLAQKLSRDPTPQEMAAELELPIEEYLNWESRFQANKTQSLDEVYSDHSALFEDNSVNPEDATQHQQIRAIMKKAVSELPEREALVLQLYYVEEMNIYEVGAILGVTTGRVSQIKKAAIGRLRDRMKGSF